MGCKQSANVKGVDRVFGANGLHVGRDGDVDLTSRTMDFFGPKFVELIKRDRLHTAKRLHLSDNKLYTLGREMTLLPDIEELYINCNRFERLPGVLGEMPSLRVLNASMNPLGHQTRTLDVVPRIAHLTQLILRDCSLSTLPPCVLHCTVLRELDLSDNPHLQLGGVHFDKLPSLRRLLIANCGIMGGLPTGIKGITTLEALDISANFFNFEDDDFFGKQLAATLTELHLRGMHLSGVPHVVVSLHKLSYLDLAENPVETLDVLAGRLVRKLTPRNILLCAGSSNAVAETCNGATTTATTTPNNNNNNTNINTNANDDAASTASHASTRLSLGHGARAGRIAYVAQPIPLTKLSLHACDLRTLPKYFHKLKNLIDIDLSDNEHLDDPSMLLFSFSKLQVLNIVGCPFAENRRTAHNEWFDIAKLRNLHTINWEVWKGVRNMSPYRTKVPLEICGLRVQQINGIKLRPGLFVGDTVQTAINLLLDGYYKVDIAMDDDVVYSYAEAVRTLNPLQSFFFSNNSPKGKSVSNGGRSSPTPSTAGGAAAAASTTKNKPSKLDAREDILQIVINRYIFFLTMQAANYDTVIIPPADVMVIHYAQMTQDPTRYRNDCEAICGQVLSCNYRLFFLEQKVRPHAVREAVVGSKRVWNMMVRTAQKDLLWLRYDFWERRAKQNSVSVLAPNDELVSQAAADAAALAAVAVSLDDSTVGTATAGEMSAAPAAPPCNGNDIGLIRGVNSTEDLRSVLETSITAHFTEQQMDRFVWSLEKFFSINAEFIQHEEALRAQTPDWTRYVKYLALYAQVQRQKRPDDYGGCAAPYREEVQNNSIVTEDSYLPRPQKSNTAMPTVPRRTMSFLNVRGNSGQGNLPGGSSGGSQLQSRVVSRRTTLLVMRDGSGGGGGGGRRRTVLLPTVEPVPTIGITLLLHSHRTAHAKYYQALVLLGIENIDIEWEDTRAAVEETLEGWMTLYNEHYVDDPNTACVITDGPIPRRGGAEKSAETPQRAPVSALRRSGQRRSSRLQRQVTLCCAESEYGIF
ncbi:lipoprotein [Trypanosoma grayi]|uniref:lipoprotein n=1 Tax=Trypanosoma grayi TaxID=71804 RepID=UPI0004F40350|nr:lipoprotein [Trypanosoma grayi]KEG06491.1 lipoprotein [Trypanosoma grayi]